MYKLIACDLDETLLNTKKIFVLYDDFGKITLKDATDKEICARNIAAIKRAEREYGVRFVPATGRGYTCIDNVLHTLGVYDAEQEYTISNNGGVVTENKNYRKLSFHELPYEIAERLFAFGIEQDVCIQVFTAEDVYAFHLNEDERSWLFSFKPDSIVCEETSLAFLKGTPITKILFQNTDIPYLHTLADQLHALTDQRVAVSFSSNRYLELNPNGVDKGLGLRDLCEHLQIDLSETIAIGDNFNDVGMLREDFQPLWQMRFRKSKKCVIMSVQPTIMKVR